jgi:hypothetical protein
MLFEQIRRNGERQALRGLPEQFRDVGGISKTILDGIVVSTDRDIIPKGAFIAWIKRWQIKARAQSATAELVTDLRKRANQQEESSDKQTLDVRGMPRT